MSSFNYLIFPPFSLEKNGGPSVIPVFKKGSSFSFLSLTPAVPSSLYSALGFLLLRLKQTPDQRRLRMKRIYFTLHLAASHPGKSGRELKAGTDGAEGTDKSRFLPYSSFPSYTPRST